MLKLLMFLFLLPISSEAQWQRIGGPNGGIVTSIGVSSANIFTNLYPGETFLSTNNGINWTSINNGIEGYNIHAWAFSGNNVFAGASGGIFLSTNNGTSWNSVNNGLTNHFINAFAVSGSNIFTGTSGGGIFLSTNNGTSWTAINNGLINLNVTSLIFLGTKLFAGTYNSGVFVSTNNGASWTSANNGLTTQVITSITISGTNLFVGTFNEGGVFLSTNSGISWTSVNNGLTSRSIESLASIGTRIFAGTHNGGVYVSTNTGLNWTQINNGIIDRTINAIGIVGTSIIAGTNNGGGLFFSSNNGLNWIPINDGINKQFIKSFSNTGGNLFVGTNGAGVFLSTNSGGSWTSANNGLLNLSVFALLSSGPNLFSGTYSGGIYLSTNNGASWTAVNSGLTNLSVTSIIKSGTNIFAGTYGGVFLSTNNGGSWTAMNNGVTNLTILSMCQVGSNLFIGTGGGVFVSTNSGTSWTAVNNGIGNLYINALTFQGTNLYAGTMSGIFLSTNNGSSWNVINSGLNSLTIHTIVVSGANLFAGTESGIFVSSNNGANWINSNQGFNALPPVESFFIFNDYIYAGTSGYSVWKRPLMEFQTHSINQPSSYVKWISGDTNRIKWTGWSNVNIKCLLNYGTPIQSDFIIVPNQYFVQTEYPWKIPDTLLSYRTKIVIENVSNPSQTIESDIFRIKPYLLTRVNSDSTYYEYKKERDQWGFSNTSEQMWPSQWYQQFNYQGVDPFTGSNYPQWQGSFAFKEAKSQNFPDWVSWVNTFTLNSCYWSTALRIYKQKAILRWKATKDTAWGGSCFGLAITNGIVFKNKAEFQTHYPSFPQFVQPNQVNSGNQVRQTVNEIFTHQFGQQHVNYTIDSGLKKTPTMTLNRIKELLLSDNDPVRSLTIYNNNGKGGHAIFPYRIIRNSSSGDIYSLYVYDNSIPLSTTPIIINTADSNGNGSWKTTDWPGWGGTKKFFLMDPAQLYLINPSLSSIKLQGSAFELSDSILQVFQNKNCFIKIKDLNGNVTGYQNDTILNDIPNSYPLIKQDGRETPPYGFQFRSNNYSVALTNFTSDTTNVYFFTGNKSFEYQRSGASLSQTDKFLFNGGLSVINTDSQLKDINLLNIQDETTQEKSFILTSLEMLQNDSLKLENLEGNNVKLTSYGSAKNYNVELNLASSIGLGIFNGINIQLPANSSHTFIPNWENLQSSQLIILEDIGNNGTIDDTLRINNIITGENGVGNSSLPGSYCLYQNYPNPFNPETLIKYDIKNNGFVSLKVYDLLGREIQTLVNEVKLPGSYNVEFNSLTLSSGIYFYRLEAGDFIQTKKMMILK